MSYGAQAVRGSEGTTGSTEQVVVLKAGAANVPGLSHLLAAAFFDDPVFNWCFPDPAPRHGILPAVFRTFIEAYLPLEETYTTQGQLAGAVCAPPGGTPDDERLAALEKVAGEYAQRAFELSERMDAEHPHESPHYYLLFLGTRPEFQSRGIGSAVLRQLLARSDREGVPAYLDATSERNKRLYLEHGFEELREVRLPGGPSFWPMWREPK
jgi:ribosomal protein S18 acetylase RimI-like enzyme